MIRELRAYDPKPGCRFSASRAEDVTPDVFVRKTRGGYGVELNQATLAAACWSTAATIRNSSPARRTRRRAPGSANACASASWLVKALDQRARTIVKVVVRNRETAAGLLRARRVAR